MEAAVRRYITQKTPKEGIGTSRASRFLAVGRTAMGIGSPGGKDAGIGRPMGWGSALEGDCSPAELAVLAAEALEGADV